MHPYGELTPHGGSAVQEGEEHTESLAPNGDEWV